MHDTGVAGDGRLDRYAWSLFGFELAMLVFFIAGTHGWLVPLASPASTDFVSFYAAGSLADAGTPWLAYDHTAHHLAEQQATEPGIAYNYFYYPPVFLLVCAILARLPYLPAFMLFQAATMLPCLLVLRAVAGRPRLILLLAFPAAFWTLGTGQNAFLTAGLFAGGIMLTERRPLLAGLLFGALCYKPHFGLLIPLALAAGGYWRAFAAAAVTAILLCLSTYFAFGAQTWLAFLQAAVHSDAVYASRSIDLGGLTTPFGVALVLGAAPAVASAIQAAATLVIAAIVWTVWHRNETIAIKGAILAAATPLAVPVAMFYDLMLVGVALAFLVRAVQPGGLAAWQRCGVMAVYVMTMLAGNLNSEANILFAPAAALTGFALVTRVAFRGQSAGPITRGSATLRPGGWGNATT